MRLDERVTIRMTELEKAFFVRYAKECEVGTATAIRDALAYFIEAFHRGQAESDRWVTQEIE